MLFLSCLVAALFASAFSINPINPDLQTIQNARNHNAYTERFSANAKRLAMRHPPLLPRSLNQLPDQDIPVSKPGPSPLPPPSSVKLCGHLQVKNCTGGSLGYVSKTLNAYGEYVITQDLDEALFVAISAPLSRKPFEIIAQNQVERFPKLGAIAGYASSNDDLKIDSSNYAFLCGVNAHIPPDSPPTAGNNSFTAHTTVTKNVETAIWRFQPSDSKLVPQWVNTDRSKPPTKLVYFGPDNLLALASNLKMFEEDFGAPSMTVDLFLVRA